MMPYCDHQNWLQRLLGCHCYRVARHLYHDSKTFTSLNACDKHEAWYREVLYNRQFLIKSKGVEQ